MQFFQKANKNSHWQLLYFAWLPLHVRTQAAKEFRTNGKLTF